MRIMIVFWSWLIRIERYVKCWSRLFRCRQTLLPANLERQSQAVYTKVMARINVEVIQAGYQLLDLDSHAQIRGRCDSFVLKTDVHFPTDSILTCSLTPFAP